MEDFYMNITSQNESYDYRNMTSDSDDYWGNTLFIFVVVTALIVCISLPLTLVAIYALCSQVQNDHVAPIYIINLLISDIIQLCCMILQVTPTDLRISNISDDIYSSALVASVCFMVFIALERYLVIAHPLWYRFRRTIKISVVVCVLVWVLALVFVIFFSFLVDYDVLLIIFGVLLFLPVPLFIFFLGGVLKALSASRVPSDEKRRIVGTLVLVLLIYTLLFLPTIILFLSLGRAFNITLYTLSLIFLQLSPLADSTLYVFMRKGIIDKLLSSVCCCRMDSDDTNSSTV